MPTAKWTLLGCFSCWDVAIPASPPVACGCCGLTWGTNWHHVFPLWQPLLPNRSGAEEMQCLVGMWLCAGVCGGVVGWILQLKSIKSTSEELFAKLDDGLTVPKCSHNSCSCAVFKKKKEKQVSWEKNRQLSEFLFPLPPLVWLSEHDHNSSLLSDINSLIMQMALFIYLWGWPQHFFNSW